MKPNFALSLSFEGIRLLHRAAGGWRVVGDVALDAADMAAELAVLRRTATALDPSGLRTKVLLPNAQIKYLTIDSDGMDADAQRDAARAALDGATPYAVDDLVFDVSNDGTRSHIAAVARETLAEAEGFAQEHRFNPISFAAVPGENAYLGEPFFGPAPTALAALATSDTIEADGIAVVIIGNAGPTDGPVVDVSSTDAEPEPHDDTAPEEAAVADSETAYAPAADTAETAKQLDIFDDTAEPDGPTPEAPSLDADKVEAAPDVEAGAPAVKPSKPPQPAPFMTPDVIEDDAPEAGLDASDAPVLDTSAEVVPVLEEPDKGVSDADAAADFSEARADAPTTDDAFSQDAVSDEVVPEDRAAQDTLSVADDAEDAQNAPADEDPVRYKPTPKAAPDTDEGTADAEKTDDAAADVTAPGVTTADVTAVDVLRKDDPSTDAAPKDATGTQTAASDQDAPRDIDEETAVTATKVDADTLPNEPESPRAAPKVALTIDLPKAAPSAGFASRRAEPKPAAPAGRVEPAVTRPPPAAPPEIFRTPTPVAADAAFEPDAPAGPSKAAIGMAAAAAAVAPIRRFLSRRKATARSAMVTAVPAAPPIPTAPHTEAERMTVFGARQSNVGGKPRFLGLILTAALLVFLAGVAAWASVFLDDGLNLSRLFGDRSTREATNTTTAPEQTQTKAPAENVVTASLDPALTPEDTAVLDALRDPVVPQVEALSQRELEKIYATSGIWSRAPSVPPEPSGLVNIDDLYLTSIDPVSSATDAVALPRVASFATDLRLGTTASPAAAGTKFALDARGLVIPTASGAVTPNGFTVYLGSPPVLPPVTLARFAAVPQDDTARTSLAALRPKNRPDDLAETNERATLNGQTRNELAAERPKLRPRSIQQRAQDAANKALAEAKAAEDAKKAAEAGIDTDAAVETALAAPLAPNTLASATRFATKASARPDTRPRNFARIVRRAQRTAPSQPEAQEETRVASRQVAPRVVTPRNPTKKSVARQATVKNAINLRKVNLIGVYGKPSSRRALVRLGNGRYKKVTVGDRIDGGRVSAISNSELRYSKGGRNVVLKMP